MPPFFQLSQDKTLQSSDVKLPRGLTKSTQGGILHNKRSTHKPSIIHYPSSMT
jgi:hypothetical protein